MNRVLPRTAWPHPTVRAGGVPDALLAAGLLVRHRTEEQRPAQRRLVLDHVREDDGMHGHCPLGEGG